MRKMDPIEGLELLSKVLLQRGSISDVRPVHILQIHELANDFVFELSFGCYHNGLALDSASLTVVPP